MTLLKMVLRKMLKNRVFILFLAIGLLISAALLSSIPMYTDASLQKLLTKDLESFQQKNNQYPGSVIVTYSPSDADVDKAVINAGRPSGSVFSIQKVSDLYKQRLSTFNAVNSYATDKIRSVAGIKTSAFVMDLSTEPKNLSGPNIAPSNDNSGAVTLESFTDFTKHIKLVDGRLPQKTANGVYEVLVSDAALHSMGIVLDKEYTLQDSTGYGFKDVSVMPVGVYTVKTANDPYWSFSSPDSLQNSMIMDQQTMLSDFVEKDPTQLVYAYWDYAFDYYDLNINNVAGFQNNLNTVTGKLTGISTDVSITVNASDILSDYTNRNQQLTSMLWSLNVPVIIILLLYMFMVSGLIITREGNEISLISSRGGSRLQIVFIYLIEGLLLGILGILLGPLLGYVVCRMMGASSGFLEFVDRQALPVSIGMFAYAYALVSILLFLVTLVVPAFRANRNSIVDRKRSQARRSSMALWEKFFIDIVLILIAAYGYYTFSQRQSMLKTTGVSALQVNIDPLMFCVPIVFILGLSLLFLRLYPYALRLINYLGRKLWRPSLYFSLNQVSRSARSYDFLMVFIILTLSIGIFSANAARTINQNGEDRIYYSNGADMVISNNWSYLNPPGEDTSDTSDVEYIEPDFAPYEELAGVQDVAKVQSNDDYQLVYKKNTQIVNVMGVEPYDFGNVVWYRDGLLPYHINAYLNLLGHEQSACIITQTLAKQYGIKVGDSISVGPSTNNTAVLNVYAIVDYWPTFNPNQSSESETAPGAGSNVTRGGSSVTPTSKQVPGMVICNLDYMQNLFGVQPYQVWLKLKPGATSQEVYQSLEKNKISPQSIQNSKQDVIALKNDPMELAMNGSLTMGFIVCGLICLMGFVLYWVIALQSRVLQFGVLRAMGLSALQLKLMIVWEQLLTSGLAMIIGVLIGLISSKLFVPFFQMSFSSVSNVPPFEVVANQSDMLKIYIFIAFTILLALGVLIYLLSKIRISNVIKLGED